MDSKPPRSLDAFVADLANILAKLDAPASVAHALPSQPSFIFTEGDGAQAAILG